MLVFVTFLGDCTIYMALSEALCRRGPTLTSFSRRFGITTFRGSLATVFAMGGPNCLPEVEVEAAFVLMRQYVRLAVAECKAEFPTWEVLQAVRIFDLKSASALDRGTVVDDLHRLSRFSQVDRHDLQEQYLRAMDLLERTGYVAKSNCNVKTWRLFMESVRKRSRENEFAALFKTLVHWRAMRFSSTSGIESGFTKVMYRISNQQAAAGIDYECAMARLIQDVPGLAAKHRAKVLSGAQECWRSMRFGRPRVSGSARRKRRRDHGTSRLSMTSTTSDAHPATEAEFLRRRRRHSEATAPTFASMAEVEAALVGMFLTFRVPPLPKA